MDTITGSGIAPIPLPQQNNPDAQSASTDNNTQPANTVSNQIPNGPTAGNSSGLLQNFVISRASLSSVGLRAPINAGDTEVLLAEVSLILSELNDQNESYKATNQANTGLVRSNFERFTINLSERIRKEINDLNSEITSLQTEISNLQAIDQTTLSETQKEALNSQISSLNTRFTDLNAQVTGLNVALALAIFLQIFVELFASLLGLGETAFFELLETLVNQESENTEENLSVILPEFQEVFEVDLEDAEIQEYIAEFGIEDENIEKAQIVSFGLLGSFFEALGVFFQQADLVELDLDSVARANNKQQRLQIAL